MLIHFVYTKQILPTILWSHETAVWELLVYSYTWFHFLWTFVDIYKYINIIRIYTHLNLKFKTETNYTVKCVFLYLIMGNIFMMFRKACCCFFDFSREKAQGRSVRFVFQVMLLMDFVDMAEILMPIKTDHYLCTGNSWYLGLISMD